MGTSRKTGPEPQPSFAPNARHGVEPETEIDAWLRNGGLVIAASERASRALTTRYHRARRAEGLAAWPAPAILDWHTFLRTAWQDPAHPTPGDDRLLLDPLQEQSIWANIAGFEPHLATSLEGPLNRMASLAMQAHQLLCSYAPRYLRPAVRGGWQLDAASFSSWLAAFDETCCSGNLLSPARLPLELIARLENASASAADTLPARPPLLLAGFDRILPIQRRLFDAWGVWQQASGRAPARDIRFHHAPDSQLELTACALWCKQQLAADPEASLLVIAQDLAQRRGEIERAFLSHASLDSSAPSSSPLFEFSLGVSLSQMALAHGAYLLLRWLSDPLAENELDWFLSSGQTAADEQESTALQTYMRTLRFRGLERPLWSLDAFLSQPPNASLPSTWVARIVEAKRRLTEQLRARRSPLDWAELVPHLLQAAGWPGARLLSSQEFQVVRHWQQAVESCASLGFDGRRISWPEFLSALSASLDDTLFAPESRDAPIQIAGPAESAGLTADAMWFMGASEDAWPASGATHPLLPPEIQREAAMPHATSQLDWELSRAIVTRLLSSAPQVCFSYARHSADAEARPSRLIMQFAGAPQPLPAALSAPAPPAPLTVSFEDAVLTPFAPGKVEGGAAVLTRQSQCPFKAFATARLAAQSWPPAKPCLTAAQRGQLLHAVLHSIWGGAQTRGISTLSELSDLKDRHSFIAGHVSRAMEQELKQSVRERLPHRYLELEEQRLIRLIGEWLEYELTRIAFEVVETEAMRPVHIAGLTFNLRLDRIDRLNDGTLLVIDYKTGLVTPKSWQPPRPDDVQLPLYAGFALNADEVLGGLVFAKVRSGEERCFTGHVADPRATMFPFLSGANGLVKNSLSAEMIDDWRHCIEEFAQDFLAGRAVVDPRDYPKTCERCGLQTLCRIQETRALVVADDGSGVVASEAADE